MYCIYQKMISCVIVGLLAFGMAAEADAQGRSTFDPESYFKSLDRNGDRRLEASELNGRAVAYLKKIGVDTNDNRISLREIERRIDRNKESAEEQAARQLQQKSGQTLKVPGFGVEAEEYSVNPFGSGEAGSGEESFSESTMKQVESAMRRYDRNNDNVIDMKERKDARWGRPDPSESDLNKDGTLTRYELMRRYHAREQEQAKHRTDSRTDRSSSSRRDESRRGNDDDRNSTSRSRASGRTTATTASNRASSSSSTSKRDSSAYEKYAKSLIKRYDKDSDNRLNEIEWKAVKRPPADADQNRDGFITQSEYANALQAAADKRSGANSSSKTSSNKTLAKVKATSGGRSTASNKRKSDRKSGVGDLSKLDKDKDHQVQMHEYSSDWDDKKLKEFYEIDKNHDGVITTSEWKAQ
ncbi:hypothetical protein N9L06_03450 [Mariniblastus sp.]|nr:hypothetical protein [Mariniblastus sp.]